MFFSTSVAKNYKYIFFELNSSKYFICFFIKNLYNLLKFFTDNSCMCFYTNFKRLYTKKHANYT